MASPQPGWEEAETEEGAIDREKSTGTPCTMYLPPSLFRNSY